MLISSDACRCRQPALLRRDRVGRSRRSRFSRIVEAALKNRFKQFVIDGEAVVLGVDGSPTSTRCIRVGATTRWII
jgi:hypothetical protein